MEYAKNATKVILITREDEMPRLRLEHLFARRQQPGAADFPFPVPTLRVGMQTGCSASPTGGMVHEPVDSIRPCLLGVISSGWLV